MKSTLIALAFSVACTSAARHSHLKALFRRQGCESGEKECGFNCIPISYTCCPDQSGGCAPNEYCGLADNGVYGCCPNGETCTGSVTGTETLSDTTTFFPSFTSSALASATATAGGSNICDTNWKVCGDGCIPESWTCCADESGGCDPLVAQCFLGSDGKYGCCPDRYTTCTGPAGDPTTIPSDFSESATPVSTTSRAIITSSARITTTSALESSVTAVGTRTISSHSTAAQTSIAIQTPSGKANQIAVRDPFAALFSAIMAAFAFLMG